eukprot:COSAG03_NODE_26774_length_257_cov_0.645570_1_plen_36_part_01
MFRGKKDLFTRAAALQIITMLCRSMQDNSSSGWATS